MEWAKRGFSECPACMSEDVAVIATDWQDKSVRLDIRCGGCGEDWYELYQLSEINYLGRIITQNGVYKSAESDSDFGA